MKVWEVEGIGKLEEPAIIQGSHEGWLTVDDRIRQGQTKWGRIRVKLLQRFAVKVLVDAPSAYAGKFSAYGVVVGVILSIAAIGILGANGIVPPGRWPILAIVIAGILGWEAGYLIGRRVGWRRTKKLPETRKPMPDWVKSFYPDLSSDETLNLAPAIRHFVISGW